jgi:hypothetical protein
MRIDVTLYWRSPPPEPSPRLHRWIGRIRNGWKPNGRVRGMGYQEKAEFFGVYIWELFNVLYPLLDGVLEIPDEPS